MRATTSKEFDDKRSALNTDSLSAAESCPRPVLNPMRFENAPVFQPVLLYGKQTPIPRTKPSRVLLGGYLAEIPGIIVDRTRHRKER